jgi:hypothetical protein
MPYGDWRGMIRDPCGNGWQNRYLDGKLNLVTRPARRRCLARLTGEKALQNNTNR